eukprot:GFUD01129757.1.p1 GENE.GFUD01129757.1~~GFUD01129757.1.p1  ORF type:complete len:331 (-),score=103.36 GFUD01129757.1:330-1322(-)
MSVDVEEAMKGDLSESKLDMKMLEKTNEEAVRENIDENKPRLAMLNAKDEEATKRNNNEIKQELVKLNDKNAEAIKEEINQDQPKQECSMSENGESEAIKADLNKSKLDRKMLEESDEEAVRENTNKNKNELAMPNEKYEEATKRNINQIKQELVNLNDKNEEAIKEEIYECMQGSTIDIEQMYTKINELKAVKEKTSNSDQPLPSNRDPPLPTLLSELVSTSPAPHSPTFDLLTDEKYAVSAARILVKRNVPLNRYEIEEIMKEVPLEISQQEVLRLSSDRKEIINDLKNFSDNEMKSIIEIALNSEDKLGIRKILESDWSIFRGERPL